MNNNINGYSRALQTAVDGVKAHILALKEELSRMPDNDPRDAYDRKALEEKIKSKIDLLLRNNHIKDISELGYELNDEQLILQKCKYE